jgi:hypothetical protein
LTCASPTPGDCFGEQRFGLAQVAVERAVVEFEQQLPGGHALADVDVHRHHAQAGQFDAQLHFLPGRDRAGSDDAALQRLQAHRRQRDREVGGRRAAGGAGAGATGLAGGRVVATAAGGQATRQEQRQHRRSQARGPQSGVGGGPRTRPCFKQANVHAFIVPGRAATAAR